MPAPATTGVLRTNIAEMEIGDYIQTNWNPTLQKWVQGNGGKIECPVAGVADGSGSDYYLYFVKVDKGLLVSDRVWGHSISWDTTNNRKNIQGHFDMFFVNSDSSEITIFQRSLTGGVAYADANGDMSLTDQNYGAWPTNNEWDRYITNFPTNKIQTGMTIDDIFHWSDIQTWLQDTPSININSSSGSSSYRVSRGGGAKVNGFWGNPSSFSNTACGFRPVFEYEEA